MSLAACGKLRRQHLNGDAAMQHRIEGVEHDAHAAPAEHVQYLVIADPADGLRVRRRAQKMHLREIFNALRLALRPGEKFPRGGDLISILGFLFGRLGDWEVFRKSAAAVALSKMSSHAG